MSYRLLKDGFVSKDGSTIPADERNANYREYLAWLANGNEPEPYVESEMTYAQKRAMAYPSIGDQLDMIYWDHVNGTAVWRETIAAVKAACPK